MLFDMLSDVFDAIDNDIHTMRVSLSEDNAKALFEHFAFGGVAYGETKRYSVPIQSLKGKNTRKYFCVWVTRTDSGRYEYGVNT